MIFRQVSHPFRTLKKRQVSHPIFSDDKPGQVSHPLNLTSFAPYIYVFGIEIIFIKSY